MMPRHGKWVVAVAILFAAAMALAPTQSYAVSAPIQIPYWVKAIAGWWSEGKISDSDFTQAMQFLVNTGVIKVDSASTAISDIQNGSIQFGFSNSTQLVFSDSNATQVTAVAYDWNPLKNAALQWDNGNMSDQDYFTTVQAAIDAGKIGPFNETQSDRGTTFQEPADATPKTVTVNIPLQDNSITINGHDSIQFVTSDSSIVYGVSPSDPNADRLQLQGIGVCDLSKTYDYPHCTEKFVADSGNFNFTLTGWYANDVSNYITPQDFTVHVVQQYKTLTVPSWVKENAGMWGSGSSMVDQQGYFNTVEELYKLGFVNNPRS